MDEPIIRNYLLKVGSSYYCSAQFMADMLRTTAPDAPQFVPISRFGIGLLSCFIACDRIEISTLRQAPPGQKAAPIRLSLDGLRGFFELRTHPLVPTPMPSDGSDGVVSQKYRTTPGTSIACRLDPTKEQGAFQLLEILNQCLLAPPVPVHFEGVSLGGDADSMSSEPWVDPSTKTMNTGDATKVSSDLGIELSEFAVSVSIKQIDLSKYSPVPELSGGFVWARMKVRQDLPTPHRPPPCAYWPRSEAALHQLPPSAEPQPVVKPLARALPVATADRHLCPDRAGHRRPRRHHRAALGCQNQSARHLSRSCPLIAQPCGESQRPTVAVSYVVAADPVGRACRGRCRS